MKTLYYEIQAVNYGAIVAEKMKAGQKLSSQDIMKEATENSILGYISNVRKLSRAMVDGYNRTRDDNENVWIAYLLL